MFLFTLCKTKKCKAEGWLSHIKKSEIVECVLKSLLARI